MKISDTIHITLETLRNRKSRTFLTVLGVSVGIGAVLFLVSFGYGLQRILLERITTAESFLTLDVASSDPTLVPLNDSALQKVSQIQNVETVSPQAITQGQVTYSGISSQITVNLVNPDFFGLNGMTVSNGRTYDSNDQNKIVVNTRVADLFKLTPDQMIGKKLNFTLFKVNQADTTTQLAGSPNTTSYVLKGDYEITGVVDEGDADSAIYMNRKDASDFPIDQYQLVKVKVSDQKYIDAVRNDLIGKGYVVSAISDTVDQANKIFNVIQIVLGIFGIIAVIVAAISLANTMTISLLERTQDIGVMRAIGASRSDIRNLFLIESTLIGLSGGVLGLIIGWTAAFLFNLGMSVLARTLGGKSVGLFYTPFWFIVFVLVFSVSVGFVTGIFPARRASRLNPLKALRYK